jgi:hypothetical protein
MCLETEQDFYTSFYYQDVQKHKLKTYIHIDFIPKMS